VISAPALRTEGRRHWRGGRAGPRSDRRIKSAERLESRVSSTGCRRPPRSQVL